MVANPKSNSSERSGSSVDQSTDDFRNDSSGRERILENVEDMDEFLGLQS